MSETPRRLPKLRFPPPPRVRGILGRVLDDDDLGRVDRPMNDIRRLYRQYIHPQRRLIFLGVATTILWSLLPLLFPLTWRYVTDNVLLIGRSGTATHDVAAPPPDTTSQSSMMDKDTSVMEKARAGDQLMMNEHPSLMIAERPREERVWGILWFFLLNSGIWTAWVLLNWARFRWLNLGGLNLLFCMRKDIHEKLLRLHVGFFDRMHSGQIMSRAIDDMNVIREWSTHQVAYFAYCFAKLFIGPLLLFYYNPKLALVVMATLPLYAWCFKVIRPQLRLLNIALRRLYSRQYAHATERIGAIRVVKAFGREGPERTSFARLAHDQVRLQMRQVLLNHGLAFAAGILTAATTALIAWLGALELAAGRMTPGTVVAVLGTVGNVFEPTNALTGLMVQVQRFFVVLRRVFAIMDEPEQVAPGSVKLTAGIRGNVVFEHVNFRYPGQERDALRWLSFNIPPGATVAVMGPSGAGKSTLFALLLRFYDPQSGRVVIDGVDLREADTASLRRHVVMVQQEPTVFSGTLAENIAYGHPDAGPADIMRAAGRAELHEFIMGLPLKYETEVGEGGVSLSGGQKQRLALATALLTDPEILLLDDTTSALDAETEQRIRTTLESVLADRTSLMITQRIATARSRDLILVLEDGKLTQQGDHATLAAVDGFYRRVLLEQEGGEGDA